MTQERSMAAKEELTKLLMESYERGQSDLIKSCQEAVVMAIETAILAEREACAKVCENLPAALEEFDALGRAADAIRARGEA